MNTITPHAAKQIRQAIRDGFSELRVDIAKVRSLRASSRILDREDAEGTLAVAWNKHQNLKRLLKYLRMAHTVKFSNLSTCGAERMAKFHASK